MPTPKLPGGSVRLLGLRLSAGSEDDCLFDAGWALGYPDALTKEVFQYSSPGNVLRKWIKHQLPNAGARLSTASAHRP